MEDESRLQLVSRIGTQLAQLNRFNKDVFLKSLKQAVTALSEIEQPLSSEASKEQVLKKLDATTQPLRESIISHSLLQKNDKEVRLYVASCITEMFRVLAPERPFEAKYLRGIFRLIVSIFKELRDTGCPFFPKRVKLLETVARCKCFVPIMEIDDDLVLEMFNIFFLVVSEHHQFSSVSCMLSILTHILDEVASQPLLEVILRNIVDQGKDASPAASQLAISVIQSRTEMLEPFVSGFLTSCIANRDAVGSELEEYYHEIIVKLFQSAPRMLLTVMPKLIQELLVDQVDVRIKAVNLIGKMLALPKNCLAEKYHDLFVEFLRRFSDKSAEVRLRALRCAKACYLANQSGANSHEILTTLRGRLLDYDDRLRLEAMTVVCDLAKSNLENFPPKLISEATERLRDKKVSVRKKALQKLLEVYRDYCKRCSEGRIITCDHFEQIPCKVLMLCYEKDCKEFRSQNIERVLVEDLFPDLEIKERRRHWVHMFSLFNAFHMRALETILSQKQRLRAELQLYLSLRKKEKGVSLDEMHRRTRSSFMKMAAFFPDPSKAEESFERLNSMKDNNIFYALEDLLDKLTIKDARIVRDKFLKLVGNKHPDLEFLQLLSSKCLYIFDAELVHCILDDLSSNVVEDNHLEASLIKLLLAIIKNFPSLLRGSEVQLRKLFEENDMIDEKLIEVLAKAGPYISVKFPDFSHFLEKACLEGTRTQAKHAVSAIASLLGSSGKSVLLELCKELMDSLRGGRNIPTVLQSLGCIAQHYALTFETQEEDIRQYIYKNIIQVGPLDDEISFDETADFDASNKLKIYGLKTLVKSFLPHKGSHFKQEINDLLVVLSKMLKKADTFDAHISCESNEAHIRLAAGKAVLRLSRQWDLHISPEIFRATVLLAKDSSTFVRRSFIDKTHKLLKAHLIPNRYACALVLAAANCLKDFQDDSFKYIAEFIKERSREAQTRQKSAVQGGSLTDYPAYIAVFLIHVLAHDTGFPPEDCHDKEKLFQFFRPLFLLLQSLLNASIVDGDMDLISNVTLYLLRIFHGIKKAEDAVDIQRTLNLHILANIGISLITELDCTSVSSARAPGQIFLPSSLYKVILAEKSKEASSKCPPLMIDQKFVERVVHILKANISQPARNLKSSKKHQEDIMQLGITKPSTSHLVACKQSDLPASGMIQSKKENVRPETSLDFRRKRTASPETLATAGSPNKRLTVEECHNGASKCSEAKLVKELLSSSDSVNVDSSLSDTLILAPTSQKRAAHLKEDVMPATLITAEPSTHREAKLKAPCCKKATRDKRGDELFCLDSDSDSPKMVGDNSLSEREVLLEADSNTIHLRRGAYGEDAAQLPGAISKQQHGYVHGKADPLAAKRKRGVKHPVKTSAKINVDAIARRTRSQKL